MCGLGKSSSTVLFTVGLLVACGLDHTVCCSPVTWHRLLSFVRVICIALVSHVVSSGACR